MNYSWQILLAIAILCVGYHCSDTNPPASGDDATDPVTTPQSTFEESSLLEITFGNGELTIRGSTFRFPTEIDTLTKLIGQPDRTEAKPANIIYVWDEFGIVAYQKHDGQQIHSFELDFVAHQYGFSPRSGFNGNVSLDGRYTINSATTTSELESAGFERNNQLPFLYMRENPPYTIVAEFEESLVGLSIDWSP